MSRNGSVFPFSVTMRYNRTIMSFLFHKRTKKVMQWIWGGIAILVIISMVLFFAPGLLYI